MDDEACSDNWRANLRDELLPYAAFYALGLLWLLVSNSVAAWSGLLGFALTALTIVIGGTVSAMVSLMMLWRALMFGVDAGRIAPMVTAACASITLLMIAFASIFPAVALGRVIGEFQVRTVLDLSALMGRT